MGLGLVKKLFDTWRIYFVGRDKRMIAPFQSEMHHFKAQAHLASFCETCAWGTTHHRRSSKRRREWQSVGAISWWPRWHLAFCLFSFDTWAWETGVKSSNWSLWFERWYLNGMDGLYFKTVNNSCLGIRASQKLEQVVGFTAVAKGKLVQDNQDSFN